MITDIGEFKMQITKKDIFIKLQEYLTHSITIDSLIDWAEYSMFEGEFDNKDYALIRDIISRIGLADVRAFGLSWDDCELIIRQLGFKIKLDFEYA